MTNSISPFEYVSILISIILGLGITQILSSFSELLYNYKLVKFYWPQTIWLVFILFLHVQDWFVTYKLKDKMAWSLPELVFVLLYPITIFTAAKMLFPTNKQEEQYDMQKYYFDQFQIIFSLIALSILLSILFNIFFLSGTILEQVPLILFLGIIVTISLKKYNNELIHKILALSILASSIFSVFLEQNVWIIK